jgi:pimeloyl-ACP methyl ester carboxylesterase
VPRERGDAFAQLVAVQRGVVVTVPGVGHSIMFDKPDDLVAQVVGRG